MKFNNKTKIILLIFSIILNIILRIPIFPHEHGADSIGTHILANSITQFGKANWISDIFSFFGLGELSYASAVPFLFSGIVQLSTVNFELLIILYSILIGLISFFSAYVMAGAIKNDDFFKFIVAINYSIVPAILTYSTSTMPTRGFFVMVSPLLVYLLLKLNTKIKYFLIFLIYAIFLFSVHHLIYFFIPVIFSYLLVYALSNYKFPKLLKIQNNTVYSLIFIFGFLLMFSIPFFTGRFTDGASRYHPIYISYFRYCGIMYFLAMIGIFYLIFKNNKYFQEYFILTSIIFLTGLIYKQTYLKWFIPVILVLFAGFCYFNISTYKNKLSNIMIVFFIISTLVFSSYYQFINTYDDVKYINEPTYIAGVWYKEYAQGTGLSNDAFLGRRIFSISEYPYIFGRTTLDNKIYNLIEINESLIDFKRYPITSEKFWTDTGKSSTVNIGDDDWYGLSNLKINYFDYNISYFIENTEANGLALNYYHTPIKSKILESIKIKNSWVFDDGYIRISALNY